MSREGASRANQWRAQMLAETIQRSAEHAISDDGWSCTGCTKTYDAPVLWPCPNRTMADRTVILINQRLGQED